MNHDNDNEPFTKGELAAKNSAFANRSLCGLLVISAVAVSLLGLPGFNALLHAFDGAGEAGPASTANFVYFILVYGAAMTVVGAFSLSRFVYGALISGVSTLIGLAGAVGYFMQGQTAYAVFLGIITFLPAALSLYLWRAKTRLNRA